MPQATEDGFKKPPRGRFKGPRQTSLKTYCVLTEVHSASHHTEDSHAVNLVHNYVTVLSLFIFSFKKATPLF